MLMTTGKPCFTSYNWVDFEKSKTFQIRIKLKGPDLTANICDANMNPGFRSRHFGPAPAPASILVSAFTQIVWYRYTGT